jgi:hypothetical protein
MRQGWGRALWVEVGSISPWRGCVIRSKGTTLGAVTELWFGVLGLEALHRGAQL